MYVPKLYFFLLNNRMDHHSGIVQMLYLHYFCLLIYKCLSVIVRCSGQTEYNCTARTLIVLSDADLKYGTTVFSVLQDSVRVA